MIVRFALIAALLGALAGLSGCTALGLRDPIEVNVAGIHPLPGQGLESRFLLELRVQNPNEQAIEYDGIFVELDVHGTRLASGVSDEHGTVPRFGEKIIALPVTVSIAAMIRQAVSLATGASGRTDYVLRGKLAGPAFGGLQFQSGGELQFPAALIGAEQ